jgi:hypothetical protein
MFQAIIQPVAGSTWGGERREMTDCHSGRLGSEMLSLAASSMALLMPQALSIRSYDVSLPVAYSGEKVAG